MASKPITAAEYRRSDLHYVDPESLVLDDDKNSSRRYPASDQEIIEMAESLITFGQKQPIECRRTTGDRAEVVFGFTRVKAARLIRSGYDYTSTDEHGVETTVHRHDPKFMVSLRLTTCNDREALLSNIEENRQRRATSCIDDAYSQRKLREQYGHTNAEIAKIFDLTVETVKSYEKLLGLDDETQMLVHSGKLAISAALDLLDVSPEVRKLVIASQMPKEGEKKPGKPRKKLNGRGVKTAIRDMKIEEMEREEEREEEAREAQREAQGDDQGERDESQGEGPNEVPGLIKEMMMAEMARENAAKNGEADRAAKAVEKVKKTPAKPRTIKEIREFFEGQTGEDQSEAIKKFSKVVVEFISGKCSKKKAQKAMNEVDDYLLVGPKLGRRASLNGLVEKNAPELTPTEELTDGDKDAILSS